MSDTVKEKKTMRGEGSIQVCNTWLLRTSQSQKFTRDTRRGQPELQYTLPLHIKNMEKWVSPHLTDRGIPERGNWFCVFWAEDQGGGLGC